jgi:hypothetical protein
MKQLHAAVMAAATATTTIGTCYSYMHACTNACIKHSNTAKTALMLAGQHHRASMHTWLAGNTRHIFLLIDT